MNFLGKSRRYGLASIQVCQCLKYYTQFRITTSNFINYNHTDHYSVNVGAVLGLIATGGGADHLTEQLTCVQVPSLT